MIQHIISVNKVKARQSSPFQGQAIEFTDTFFFNRRMTFSQHDLKKKTNRANTLVWVNSTKMIS